MSDIFISYSRKDSEQALALAERLRSEGMGVWIDQHGIEGAEQWATEIVEGIRACNTFIILLSQSSIESENVLRELSLASEKRKRVLPVDIEPTVLPSSFEYPLAGLQRVPFAEFDRILHAHKHGVKKVIQKDERKSLMILPFEDLSPGGDNQWFAEGIVSEMITSLSHLKALRVADQQTTKDFKRYLGTLPDYAREMRIHYFVQGDVRKIGDNIKITARLLDIETGDHLWQEALRGTMDNIFDFQEEVALKVVEGMKLHLAPREKKKLLERGTENAEAYELFLKSGEYFGRHTKEGFQLAIQLCTDAIKLDPLYANAYLQKARAIASLYRAFRADAALLDEGLQLIKEALRLKPELWSAYAPLSHILQLQGKIEEAEQAVMEYIKKDPDDFGSHFTLGFFYNEIKQDAKAIAPFEQAIKFRPDHLMCLFNLVVCCNWAKQEQKQIHWAEAAIPLAERRLKLFPNDENSRVQHALLLHWAGRDGDAREAARWLENLKDGYTLYNTACLQSLFKDSEAGLKTFRRAIKAGFRNAQRMKDFMSDVDEGVGKLQGTPEYEEVMGMVEKIESEPGLHG
jgi:adenylate cyclase